MHSPVFTQLPQALQPETALLPTWIISVEISFDSFVDKVGYYHEFSTSISLEHDILIDSETYILGICELGYNGGALYAANYNKPDRLNKPNYALRQCIYGDIFLTANDELDDNLIIGTINKDFVNVKQQDLYMYDATSYSLLNGLKVYGDGTYPGTSAGWSDTFHPDPPFKPLTKFIIEDQFQVFNKVRKEINSDIYSLQLLKPLTLVNTNMPNPGTVQVTAARTVIGTNTQFLSMFRTTYQNPVEYDHIYIDGETGYNAIVSIESDTEMHMLNDFNVFPSAAGLSYTGGRPKAYYINGFQYIIDQNIYSNMSLKEFVDNDEIS